MKTTVSVTSEQANREWWVVDLKGQTLGRTASRIASILRGKHKPTYTPHNDTGDFVIVINADQVVLKGRKLQQKIYYKHSGYFGGMRSITAEKQLQKHPTRVIESAVRGMLPRTPLGRRMFRKLKIYAGPQHPHQAQKPRALDLGARPGVKPAVDRLAKG